MKACSPILPSSISPAGKYGTAAKTVGSPSLENYLLLWNRVSSPLNGGFSLPSPHGAGLESCMRPDRQGPQPGGWHTQSLGHQQLCFRPPCQSHTNLSLPENCPLPHSPASWASQFDLKLHFHLLFPDLVPLGWATASQGPTHTSWWAHDTFLTKLFGIELLQSPAP